MLARRRAAHMYTESMVSKGKAVMSTGYIKYRVLFAFYEISLEQIFTVLIRMGI